MNKFAFISLVFILLLAGNVYQYYNPNIIEVPTGQEEIDLGAWVQRAAYMSRGVLLDSLREQNTELASRVRESRDRIANLTIVNGRLNVKVDSLQTQVESQPIDLAGLLCTQEEFVPQTLHFPRTFGSNLFEVVSAVTIERDNIYNEITLEQLRDIQISVTNTMTDDRSRMLTYVSSRDFVELEYQTFTELDYKSRKPMFLYGAAAGILITVILN